MIKPGIKSTEFYMIGSAIFLTFCEVIGVDAKVFMAQLDSPELGDIIKIVKEAHSTDSWKSLVAMWGGVGLYTWLRSRLKETGKEMS